MEELELIKELYDHLITFCYGQNIPKEDRPILDIQVAQQNEMIIANKKISDQEE
jgi:hypothetical protein